MQTPFRIEDAEGAAARREAAVQRLRVETGIDEAMIDALVEGFYACVRDDRLIGPIFADRIADWGPHLAQMKLFWSSVALSTGVYQGRPMPKHLPLPIDARHFDRWLELFAETAQNLCPPVAAAPPRFVVAEAGFVLAQSEFRRQPGHIIESESDSESQNHQSIESSCNAETSAETKC